MSMSCCCAASNDDEECCIVTIPLPLYPVKVALARALGCRDIVLVYQASKILLEHARLTNSRLNNSKVEVVYTHILQNSAFRRQTHTFVHSFSHLSRCQHKASLSSWFHDAQATADFVLSTIFGSSTSTVTIRFRHSAVRTNCSHREPYRSYNFIRSSFLPGWSIGISKRVEADWRGSWK